MVRFSAACLFLLASAAVAFAENVKIASLVSGNWKGGAYADRNSGRLSHCGLYATYRSGITVHFFLGADYDWSIGFADTGATLVPGRRYAIHYSIDGGPPARVEGVARTNGFIRADLPDTTSIYDQFRYGGMLSVAVEGQVHRFRLTGTANALSALLDCVGEHAAGTGVARPAKPADPPATAPAKRGRTITADDRLDAVRFVANVFAKAEMRDYRFMTAEEVADKRWPEIVRLSDVAWISKDQIGFLHIFATEVLSIDDALGAAIGSDAKNCDGDFASGKINEPGSALTRVFTVCKSAKAPFSVEYVFIPRKAGLAYRFATYRFDAVRPDTKPLGEAMKSI